jgi:isopenicillin N synthase-like dioxygenase
MTSIPVVDIGALIEDPTSAGAAAAAAEIDAACRADGFFSITGHRVPIELATRLDAAARAFFELPDETKAGIAMERAGRAWRGWFPMGGELTSGRPDLKEGLYFGEEHAPSHPRVQAGVPLHGANQFPAVPAELAPAVREWMDAMANVARAVMQGVALGWGLPPGYFESDLTAEPTVLFRIFHYPPGDGAAWGVGEHTDYGLLTILMQDDCGGLQVHGPRGWIDVAPIPGAFVCNIGDMLDRMTAGTYRSTAHRVRNTSGRDRLSFPFFFDPGWDAVVHPLPVAGSAPSGEARRRWDHADPHEWTGTYGDYLLAKVAKVFPKLA